MANEILGTRSPNGEVGVRGVADSGELSMLSAGILSGFDIVIGSGFNLTVGGAVGVQDVVVTKNSAGESDLLVGNGSAMTFTLLGAPGTSGQSQVHSLVVWKDTTVVSTVNDGLDAVGYQVVSGAAVTAGSQVAPTEAEIRAAIPQGATAFMAIVANITLNYGDAVPVASRISSIMSLMNIPRTRVAIDLGYSYYVWFSRVGNTVFCSDYQWASVPFPPFADFTTLSQKIPVGWRPTQTSVISAKPVATSNGAIFSVDPLGALKVFTDGVAASNGLTFIGQWYTTDPWPG